MAKFIFDLTNETAQVRQDSHITLDFKFTNADGVAVDVTNPSVSFVDANGDEVGDLYLLKDIEKREDNVTGYYRMTIMTYNLSAQTYTVTATGTYGDETLTVSGSVTFRETPRLQCLIEMVKTAVGDIHNEIVPRRYMTRDPDVAEFIDKEIVDALKRVVNFINEAPPPTPGNYQIDNIPCTDLLITGAMYHLLLGKGVWALANQFAVNYPTSVQFTNSSDYASLAKFVADGFFKRAEMWKRLYYHQTAIYPIIIAMSTYSSRYHRAMGLSMDSTRGFYATVGF